MALFMKDNSIMEIKKEMEKWLTPVETLTKESGLKMWNKDKELWTGYQQTRNIQGTGAIISKMVEEFTYGLILVLRTNFLEIGMMVNGLIVNDKASELFIIIMELNMMVIGRITKEMVLEFWLKKLERLK